jgi:predicted aminopeptidase
VKSSYSSARGAIEAAGTVPEWTLPRRFRVGWTLVLLLIPFLFGCESARFYGQAIHGQCQIIHRQTSIARLLTRTNLAPELAAKLRLVLALRTFAENELELPANGHYLSYADLERPYAVWNVYAAPEFSLEARSWWYPIVGRLKYRGYFNERSARDYAAGLATEGYDVHVGGVQAYSTLGWFRDPVLNTFVFDSDTELAELLFHELAHQKVFVAGDTDFNEALATSVAEEGVRRWLRVRNRPEVLDAYEADARRDEQFIELLSQTRIRLQLLYTNAPADLSAPETAASLRAGKTKIFAELNSEYQKLKAGWGGTGDYDNWFLQPLNNARLNTVETYYRWVPAFRRMLQDRCDGRLDRFFTEAQHVARLPKEKRQEYLNELLVRLPE